MTGNLKKNIAMTLLIGCLLCWAAVVQAAVPGQISYQGMLTDDVGMPLYGTYSVRFYLYDAVGTLVWEEQQDVVVTDGIYNVQLGVENPIGPGVFSGGEVYLGVAIYNADATSWETLSPRQRLTSTAYAFQAENARTLEGQEAADFAPSVHVHSGGDISSGTVDEARIDPDIARDVEISWGNLSGIPADIADGDQVGISTEMDPTITDPSVKDGVSWSELSGIPAAFADGVDNIGLTEGLDYGRSGVSSNLYEGTTALSNKYVGKSGSHTITNGNLTVNSAYGIGNAAVTGVKGFAQSDTFGFGVIGEATGSQGYGVYGGASGSTGTGVYGEATNTNDFTNYGGYFTASGYNGVGVFSEATHTGDFANWGGYFVANGSGGTGVFGTAASHSDFRNWGGYFTAYGSTGIGVYGRATKIGDVTNYGGYFNASGSTGRGVYGEATYTGDVTNYGGYFTASGSTGTGVYGEAPLYGLHGRAWGSNGRGVYGEATGSDGSAVYGWAGNTGNVENYGGHFTARGAYGRGVQGEAPNISSTNHGGFFTAAGATGRGVYGGASGAEGRGVYGKATATGDVRNYGGYFIAEGQRGMGVYAEVTGGGIRNYGGYFLAEGTYGRGLYAKGRASGVEGVGGDPSDAYSGIGVLGTAGFIGVEGHGQTYDFWASGPGDDYGSASSIRWKQNIHEIEGALEMVLQMRGVYFDWDEEHGGHNDLGFIAEEVGEYVPEIVSYEQDSQYTTGMDYSKMTPILLQAIKEQQGLISELRAEIETIKDEIKANKSSK
jgi:hypothetical protein